jgi:hypothetical protein
MFMDIKRRLPWYWSDIRDGIHPKIFAATIFMFFASIAPALSFGEYLNERTEHQIGVIEVLLSTSFCGMLYAIFSGQPLVIIGVTGPISIFTATTFNLAVQFKLPILPWMAVIGFWSAAMHIILSVTNATNLIKLVTRFTTELFGVLIAVIYIVTAIEDIVKYFRSYHLDGALFCLIIAYGLQVFNNLVLVCFLPMLDCNCMLLLHGFISRAFSARCCLIWRYQ